MSLRWLRLSIVMVVACVLCFDAIAQDPELWTTTFDRRLELSKVENAVRVGDGRHQSNYETLSIIPTIRYQSIVGFGGTLTDGSIQVINSLPVAQRTALLDELFRTSRGGIGLNVLRISVGASDLSPQPYTYNDNDSADPQLTRFDMSRARESLIPMLRDIRRRNPDLILVASPWTAPKWMKSNDSYVGGSLRSEHYATYADYLVRYLQTMKDAGLSISYLTVQNEPENAHNNPSMLMTATEQAEFIGKFLGPRMETAGLETKIMAFDHNCDHPEYPLTVLQDTDAHRFVDGSAFHLYAGSIDAMQVVHDAFPQKHVYFTEQWTSASGEFGGDLNWHAKNILIGSLNHWSRMVLEWNIAADPKQEPHTEGGCDACLGALTIGESVQRNQAYFLLAHAAKFIRSGSVRVKSDSKTLPNVAFERPEGSFALLILNEADATKNLVIQAAEQTYELTLAPRSLNTVILPAVAP